MEMDGILLSLDLYVNGTLVIDDATEFWKQIIIQYFLMLIIMISSKLLMDGTCSWDEE